MEELITWLRGCYGVEEGIARKALGEGFPRVDQAASAGEAHIAAWTPERVLADLALKQQVLGLHRPADGRQGCASCVNESWPCLTVRLLAMPYADRPGFRQEWRP